MAEKRRRNSTPNTRASDGKKEVERVKRSYKKNVKTKAKLLPVEIPHVKSMVVVLKVGGYTRTQMAKIIGISRGQVATFLEDPDVVEQIIDLRKSLPKAALDLMHGYMIEAVQAIVDVMRTTTDDALVLKAAADVLDRGGIPKASRQERVSENTENHNVKFDTDFMELIRQASPEVQEQAAKAIEELENLLKSKAEEIENETSE